MIDKAQAPGAVARTWLIDHIAYPAVGVVILIALWAIGGWFLEVNPSTSSFVKFGLVPTMQAVPGLVSSGYVAEHVIASGYRLAIGLFLAILIGVPIGIALGLSRVTEQITNEPF